MNIQKSLELEMKTIHDQAVRYPELLNALDGIRINDIRSLYQLLGHLMNTKNSRLILNGVTLIQKLASFNEITIADMGSLLDFFQQCRSIQDEQVQIKIVSTMLHILNKHIIDLSTKEQFMRIINIFLMYYQEDNAIIQQSALQGIFTLISILEQELKDNEQSQKVFIEVLNYFFKIYQDLENIQASQLLCKDIFIMLLRAGKNCLEVAEEFYTNQLYTYLKQMEFTQDLLQNINKVRLIFSYIYIMEGQLELLYNMMKVYMKLPTFDILKLAIHDGILFLIQNIPTFVLMFTKSPDNQCRDYFELILKVWYDTSLSTINIFKIQISPKQQNILNQYSITQLDINSQQVPMAFINQTRLLIQYVTDNLIKINPSDYEELYQSYTDKQQDAPILQNQKLTQSQHVETVKKSIDGFDDYLTINTQIDVETSLDNGKFRANLDGVWKPIMKIYKHLLLKADNQQFTGLLEILPLWLRAAIQLNHKRSFEQIVRFLASQAAPQNLKYNESDKWIIASTSLGQAIQQHFDIFTPKIWNYIFQTLQRIEQVTNKETEQKYINEIFFRSRQYQESTIQNMIDALNQLSLQVSERLQISQKKQQFDSVYKSFSLEKLVVIVSLNWDRVLGFWKAVEALILCLSASKIMEMRLNTINSYKDIIYAAFDYFSVQQSPWGNNWGYEILKPFHEMIISQYEDVVENSMNLINNVVKQLNRYMDQQTYVQQLNRFSEIIKILESAITELMIKTEIFYNSNDTSQSSAKSLFLRVVLSINCLSEIIFNYLDKVDNQSLNRLSSIAVLLNTQDQFNQEFTHKIICMTWQLQERMLIKEQFNPKLHELCIRLIKEYSDSTEDLKFAALVIAAQYCLQSKNELFEEYSETFEEICQQQLSTYLKLEHHQIQITQQTPRFNNLPLETPKFVNQSKLLLSDKNTNLQNYKQYLELVKLQIQKVTDIIIKQKIYPKYFFYLQLFNQAQSVFIKAELIQSIQKMLEVFQEKILNEYILDYCHLVISNVDKEDLEDCKYFSEQGTLNRLCKICQLLFNSQINSFDQIIQLFRNILQFQCQDNMMSIQLEGKNLYQYFESEILPKLIVTQQDIKLWITFINEYHKSLGIQMKYHQLIDFLSSIQSYFLQKCEDLEFKLEKSREFIHHLVQLNQKSSEHLNDNCEKLQYVILARMKQILIIISPIMDKQSLLQIIDPFNKKICNHQIKIILEQRLKKKNQDWIGFLINDLFKVLKEDQNQTLMNYISDYYIQQLKDNNQDTILNVINFLDSLQVEQKQQLENLLEINLINSIKQNFDELNINEITQECQFNIQLIQRYLLKKDEEQLRALYMTFVNMIKIGSQEVRLGLIELLQKFAK